MTISKFRSDTPPSSQTELAGSDVICVLLALSVAVHVCTVKERQGVREQERERERRDRSAAGSKGRGRVLPVKGEAGYTSEGRSRVYQ